MCGKGAGHTDEMTMRYMGGGADHGALYTQQPPIKLI